MTTVTPTRPTPTPALFEPVRGPVRQRMELFRSQRLARCTGVSYDRPHGGLIAQRER